MARDQVMDAIREIGLDRRLFGMHSFRRGGATEAARRGVSDRLFKSMVVGKTIKPRTATSLRI